MEEHGVIADYTARINPEALGNSLTAFIRLRLPENVASDYDPLLPTMAAWPDVLDVLEMHHAVSGFLSGIFTAGRRNGYHDSIRPPIVGA